MSASAQKKNVASFYNNKSCLISIISLQKLLSDHLKYLYQCQMFLLEFSSNYIVSLIDFSLHILFDDRLQVIFSVKAVDNFLFFKKYLFYFENTE